MANIMRITGTDPVDRQQVDNVVNAHADNDICYEQGYYGIADDDVLVGGSFRMIVNGIAVVTMPVGTLAGARLGCATKPAGAITLVAGGAVPLGICKTPPDGSGLNGEFHFVMELSIGL